MQDTQHKQLIIGAGFVGLGIAQSLKAADIPYDQVDASDDIGGNWYHGVYSTAHIISSKQVTQFTQLPAVSQCATNAGVFTAVCRALSAAWADPAASQSNPGAPG
jgi:cation diffusion facilitator CzcD-associated flavoprotein CzcO